MTTQPDEEPTIAEALDALQRAATLGTLWRVAEPLQAALDGLNTWIVKDGTTPKAEDLVLDDEDREFDEALLGVGFVACQASMAHVASRALALAELCKKNNVVALTTWCTKEDLYKSAEPLVADGPTRIQFANAVANYFKHRDEWGDTKWLNLSGVAAKTVAIISAGGLSQHSKENLRTAVAVLRNDIIDAVAVWAASLIKQAKQELSVHC